jgi:GNAT superfamily N-acetyltransferase
MLRIRKIVNPLLEVNRRKIAEVKEVMKKQFSSLSDEKTAEFIEQLLDPLKFQSLTSLFIAEDINNNLKGFALLMYMPDHNFCYLDFMAVTPGKASSGIGGALYERVREEAISLNSSGVFFECLPDDPKLCNDNRMLEENKRRLAFYERFGARPIINTKYEVKVKQEDDCPPYLVFDGLNRVAGLEKNTTKKIIRAILERKYSHYCDDNYIRMVIDSVEDDPVQIRQPKYLRKSEKTQPSIKNDQEKIFLYINEKHSIHHIKERGAKSFFRVLKRA